MQEFQKLAFFEKTIGGVTFTVRRRSTSLMMKIGDINRVFGLISGANAKKSEGNLGKAAEEYAVMLEKFSAEGIYAIDGKPSKGIPYEDLQHVADALFGAFLVSGLELDPTPDSLKGQKESRWHWPLTRSGTGMVKRRATG